MNGAKLTVLSEIVLNPIANAKYRNNFSLHLFLPQNQDSIQSKNFSNFEKTI
jgi:hypothetical protein